MYKLFFALFLKKFCMLLQRVSYEEMVIQKSIKETGANSLKRNVHKIEEDEEIFGLQGNGK